jgi:chromosome segregation ATPase
VENRKIKLQDMKKILFFAMCLLVLASCKNNGNTQQTADLNQRIDSLNRVNVQKDNEISDMLETLNTIEEGFRAINEAQGRVTVERRGEGADAAQRIRENMQFINETMSQNKELINKLRLRLRDSNTASDQLRKTLENLTAQLEAKESELAVLREELEAKDIHIAELDEQVTQLNEDVTQLKDDKVKKEETISQQDKELNTAWYVFGTKRELKEQKILQSGEVLQGNFNKDYFTKIDIRVDKEIRLMSRDAKLLTNHPASSYTLERDANKQYVLRITNPQQFWSTSKYLVVQVK